MPLEPETSLVFSQVIVWLYRTGAAVVLLLAVRNIFRTWLRTKRAMAHTAGGHRLVFSPAVSGAYSVFGTIFVNDKYRDSPMLGQIIAHEKSHIVRRHSLDLIWMNLCRSLLWFNRLVWHSTKLLREVHEFQADRDVILQGTPVVPYVELLIATEAGIYPGTAHAFSYSLTRKRLRMLARATRKTGVGGYLRLAALLPVTGLLAGTFSLTSRAAEPEHSSLAVRMDKKEGEKENRGPLFVLDHVILEDKKSFEEMAPASYRRIAVLTGEDATRAYGEAGRNGVIVVTTEKKENQAETNQNGAFAITDGEIRVPQENLIGTSGTFDSARVRRITVRISKTESNKGVTAAAKALQEYPDLF